MKDRQIIRKYLRKEMRKIINPNRIIGKQKLKETTFAFCWGQAKFDALMDIDRILKLKAFYK